MRTGERSERLSGGATKEPPPGGAGALPRRLAGPRWAGQPISVLSTAAGPVLCGAGPVRLEWVSRRLAVCFGGLQATFSMWCHQRCPGLSRDTVTR